MCACVHIFCIALLRKKECEKRREQWQHMYTSHAHIHYVEQTTTTHTACTCIHVPLYRPLHLRTWGSVEGSSTMYMVITHNLHVHVHAATSIYNSLKVFQSPFCLWSNSGEWEAVNHTIIYSGFLQLITWSGLPIPRTTRYLSRVCKVAKGSILRGPPFQLLTVAGAVECLSREHLRESERGEEEPE